MSDNCTQAENLKEKNTGNPAKEFDHEESADDSILDSDGKLVSGQRSQQLGHSSRKHIITICNTGYTRIRSRV